MYSTCIFCHSSLEANDDIEHFPVGRRLAFDAGRGRLWVICRRCRQWNLTPTEERWEAIEECERFYRATKLRVSTDQIGLARLPSGVELVGVRGLRVVTPDSSVFRNATLGRLFEAAERAACDMPYLRNLGGCLIRVERKS